jgi:hypothetical protein
MTPTPQESPAATRPGGHQDRWYELDAQDRIVSVDEAWDHFAQDNDGPEATAGRVLGRRLADFLAGDPTRMFMDVVLQAARLTGQPRELPYRCDGPGHMRRFLMRVIPMAAGRVRVEHHLVETAERRPSPRFIERAQARRLRCSLCLAVRRPGGLWVGVDALQPGDLHDAADPPANRAGELVPVAEEQGRPLAPVAVLHSLCPDCLASLDRKIAA